MPLDRIRPDELWNYGSTILPAEMQELDGDRPGTVHEVGGTWAFQSATTLAGDVLSLQGVTELRLTGAAVRVPSPTTLTVQGATTLAGASTVSGALTVTGAATHSGALTMSGASGTTTKRTQTIPVGGGGPTFTVDVSADRWLALGTLPATTLTIVLRSSTAPIPISGQSMRISRLGVGSGNISIQREDGTVIAVLPADTRSSIDVDYWPGNGGWLLTTGFEYTLGAAP